MESKEWSERGKQQLLEFCLENKNSILSKKIYPFYRIFHISKIKRKDEQFEVLMDTLFSEFHVPESGEKELKFLKNNLWSFIDYVLSEEANGRKNRLSDNVPYERNKDYSTMLYNGYYTIKRALVVILHFELIEEIEELTTDQKNYFYGLTAEKDVFKIKDFRYVFKIFKEITPLVDNSTLKKSFYFNGNEDFFYFDLLKEEYPEINSRSLSIVKETLGNRLNERVIRMYYKRFSVQEVDTLINRFYSERVNFDLEVFDFLIREKSELNDLPLLISIPLIRSSF